MNRPFTARSVIASALLGTVPPALSGRLLVALSNEFGIAEGTARVALSRMVERGELTNRAGTYQLAGPMVDRQERQETSLAPVTREWDGSWEMVVVRPGPRANDDRASLRTALDRLRLREYREGVWLRPDNLDSGRLPGARAVAEGQTDRFGARPEGDPEALAASLFDLDAWASGAGELLRSMSDLQPALDACDRGVLVSGFEVAAAVLRQLVADPLIPPPLLPADWPGERLRASYVEYDRSYRRLLRAFFADHRKPPQTESG